MNSSRYADGLRYLAQGNFSIAATKFKIILADPSVNASILKANILYFYAVSSLGALLNKLSKEPKAIKATKLESNHSLFRQLFIDGIIKVAGQLTSNLEVKKQESLTESQKNEIEETAHELQAICSQFEAAKNAMRPRIMGGVEYAINHFIKNLSALNQGEFNQRAKCFSKELMKFQLLYSTKLYVTTELEAVEEEYFFRFFIPEQIKRLRNIFDINKSDPLFLSYAQINQLYKQQQAYQYNEKQEDVFKCLQECIWLSGHFYTNKEYVEILKKYKGGLNIDHVILIHDIYNDFHLKELRIIIKELNDNHLLNDKIFKSFAGLITQSNDYRDHLKILADAISSSHSVDKDKLFNCLFSFALDRMPHDKFTDHQFSRYIAYVKTSCISADDNINIKKIDIYLDLLALFTRSGEEILLNQVSDLMKETEIAIGSSNFIAICEKTLTYKMSYSDFISMLNLGLQFRKDSVKELLVLMDSHHADVHTIKNKANELLLKEYQKKFPERPLDDVIHDFLTKSNDVEFPIDQAELKQLQGRYIQIKNIGEKLMTTGRAGLQSELKKCKTILARDPENETAQMTLLAIIRLQVRDQLGIYPYNIQMLNVLALLNQPKRIGQIKTGEGKSTLIAMLAAYFGLQNRTVDIITTSHDLAIRDAEKFAPFYRALGVGIGHNVSEDKQNSDCYENAVVYGTVSDFEFAYLRGETQDGSGGRGDRPYDVVIADEVDSMFIDMQRNEAILSRPRENAHKADVYESIWSWINETAKQAQTRENLQAMLKSKGTEISLELAATWLKNAQTAQRYTEEKEYIIGYPESKSKNREKNEDDRIIKIVNKANTGEVEGDTTRWQGGLHEILEAKHKLKVRVESLTTASISHIEYFNKYKTLIGLTGTLGSQASRDELNQLYKVSTYDSPPYKPSLKKQISHLIESDEKAQMNQIDKIVKQQMDAGRPVLILCESIQDSKKLNKQLAKKIKSTQIYNGVQMLSADAILGLAGNPGVVTIATNLAGRGTDIVTTPEAESHGGLHVILTFPAINQRVEQQAFGRTGRQGKQGTYHYILCDNQLSDSEKRDKTIDEKISKMRANREIRERIISADNVYNYNIMHKIFILQTVFFALPMPIKSNHMTEWATFKTETNKHAAQFMRDELDESDENVVMLSILNQFNEFWKTTLTKYGDNYKTPIDFIKTRLKQFIPDDHTKRLWQEAVLFFENPKMDFSSELTDIWLDLKSSEWLPEENVSHLANNFIHFLPAKAATSSAHAPFPCKI